MSSGGQDEAWKAAWLRLAGSLCAKIAYPVSRKQHNFFCLPIYSCEQLSESTAKNENFDFGYRSILFFHEKFHLFGWDDEWGGPIPS